MSEKPDQDEINKWHRYFGVEGNNRAWDLASKAQRTAAEDQEMLNLAYTAAYHWSKVGKPVNDARADVTLAHVHALLKHGELALKYAQRSLAFCEQHPNEREDWDLAFAHMEMAHAAAALGDPHLHAQHYAEARRLGQGIAEEEDRKVFLEELARIPAKI